MTLESKVREFLSGFGEDPVEDRVCDYVVDEIGKGRVYAEILEDPYVKNRMTEDRRLQLLENCEVVDAVDDEVKAAFGRLEKDSPGE